MCFRLVLLSIVLSCFAGAETFKTGFTDGVDRYFVSPDIWTNPMEAWKVRNGRLEVDRPTANLNAQNLTHQIKAGNGSFSVEATVGALKGKVKSTGFRIGIKSQLGDYRSALLFGRGLNAGIDEKGNIFIANKKGGKIDAEKATLLLHASELDGKSTVTLVASVDGKEVASIRQSYGKLSGNIALVCNFNKGKPSASWFDDWKIDGDKISYKKDQTFGPILWSQYSLSRKVMKMVVLLAPIDTTDTQTCKLQVKKNGAWETVQESKIHPQSRTANFRQENWDDTKDHEYRISYDFKDDKAKLNTHHWSGTVRKDPIDKKIEVAGFTGNTDPAFPNAKIVKNVLKQNPDVLFFSGDQIYEQVGGYGIIREEGDASLVNYLRKYYLFGWAFRDLMKDRPSIILPDDHDVYQGNIWGNGGNQISMAEHSKGGYNMFADFVNTVHRTQVSHHPDAFDPTPLKRNISVYHGDMVYGRVSFAIIADRMFKSGPEGLVNDWKGRPDHCKDPNYPVEKLDNPKAKLLGDRQLKFLDEWSKDWKGADMKVVLSQTIFCNLANYHGPKQEFIFADLDSNGWPQTGRNKALEVIRKGFGFMYAGDQHLASIVQHGTSAQADSGFSFCVPSIAAGYPRSWRPDSEGRPIVNRIDGLKETGDYEDGFKNKVRVFAIANPEKINRKPVLERLHDKASGHGVITLDKQSGDIKMECFKLLFDADNVKKDDQFPGWPRTVNMSEMYGKTAKAYLPEIKVSGLAKNPVFQVIDSAGNVVYTIRNTSSSFRPKVFAKGTYSVKVGEPDSGKWKTLSDLKATSEKSTLEVKF